ncbi:MAG: transporter, partial [Oscillospiraceae bacterium]
SLTNHLVDSVWPTINEEKWASLTETQQGWVLEAAEAGRKVCDEKNLKTESEVQEFLKGEGLAIYEADVPAFAEHVLKAYLDSDVSASWDMDLYEQIQALA